MAVLGTVRFLAARLTARVSPRGERGASAVEYGILIFLIAATIILAVVFLGSATSEGFDCTADSVRTSATAC